MTNTVHVTRHIVLLLDGGARDTFNLHGHGLCMRGGVIGIYKALSENFTDALEEDAEVFKPEFITHPGLSPDTPVTYTKKYYLCTGDKPTVSVTGPLEAIIRASGHQYQHVGVSENFEHLLGCLGSNERDVMHPPADPTQSKPLVHLLFIGIKTPAWCNDAVTGTSLLLDRMKAEGSSIIAIGDKEMTDEDNREAYAKLKAKVQEITDQHRTHDRWVIVLDNKNFACTVGLDGNIIEYIYDRMRPGIHFYLYEDKDRSQYDRPAALYNTIVAAQHSIEVMVKADDTNLNLAESNPHGLIRSLLVLMVRHLNGNQSQQSLNNLHTLINLTERMLRQGKLLAPPHNQQQKETIMSGNRKELKDLIARAAASLESDGPLTTDEVQQLSEDLRVAHRNFDTIVPEEAIAAAPPASVKNVNLILDGLSDQNLGESIMQLLDELHMRGGRVFLFNQPDAVAGQDIGNAAALTAYLKIAHPESTWVSLKIDQDPEQERPLGEHPLNSVAPFFRKKVKATNLIEMTFGHNSRIDRPRAALHGALMTQLTRVGDVTQPQYAPGGQKSPEDVMTRVSEDVLSLQQTLQGLFPNGIPMPDNRGMNYQVFGRGARPFSPQPFGFQPGYRPAGQQYPSSWQQDLQRQSEAMMGVNFSRPNSFGQAAGWVNPGLNPQAFDGVIIVYVNGLTAANSWARFESVMANALPSAAVHMVQYTLRHGRSLQDFVADAEHSAKDAHGRNKVFHAVFLDVASTGPAHDQLREFQQQLIWGGLSCTTLTDITPNPEILLTSSVFGMELAQFMARNVPFRGYGAPQATPMASGFGSRAHAGLTAKTRQTSGYGPSAARAPRLFEELNRFEGVLTLHAVGKHNAHHLHAYRHLIQALIPQGQVEIVEYSLKDIDGVDASSHLMASMLRLTNPDQLHVVVSPAGLTVPFAPPGIASTIGYTLHAQLMSGTYPGAGVVTLLQEAAITGVSETNMQEVFVDLIMGLLQLQATRRSIQY